MTVTELTPVTKTAIVPLQQAEAFELFADLESWWPGETHSIAAGDDGSARPDRIVFEQREGGEVYELKNGERAHWAKVLVFDPPNRLVLEWQVNPDAAAATEVEVRFTTSGEGTQVELVHRGWERLGPAAEESRTSYDTGWDSVFGRYLARART